MAKTVEHGKPGRFEFYSAQYARFASDLACAMRREVYGEDQGQQGWRTLDEQELIAKWLSSGPQGHVLDVGCGSGGPSLALMERFGGYLTGVDVEAAAIAYGQAQAEARHLADRLTFKLLDGSGPLPFEDKTFDGIVCIDAVNHLGDRDAALREWARLLHAGGRVVFTDPVVVTGPVAKSELDVRASIGAFVFVPPGINEVAMEAAGLRQLHQEDRSSATADVAARWHEVRQRNSEVLEGEEGAEWFAQRQAFLATTAELARSRRLSRILYVAEKPA
jgi:ubiquinone/menaquinone biosynthesis C-methylase UbiE